MKTFYLVFKIVEIEGSFNGSTPVKTLHGVFDFKPLAESAAASLRQHNLEANCVVIEVPGNQASTEALLTIN